MKISRRSAALFAAPLIAIATSVAVPSVANAAEPTCATAAGVTQCQGVSASGAQYSFSAPANFNGTVYL